jgi:DNA-binding NarL/FixJ family response regulator
MDFLDGAVRRPCDLLADMTPHRGEVELRAAVAAVLEALGAPAWVVDADGEIETCNRAAATRSRCEAEATRAWLRAAVARASSDARVLAIDGVRDAFLVIERTDGAEHEAHARLGELAARLRLTPRQRELLEAVSRGMSNRAIATVLGISEATVEQHLATIMVKAGVESRAALIALLLWR